MNKEEEIPTIFKIIYCVICITLSIILIKNANDLKESTNKCKCYTNNNYNTCYCSSRR